MRLRQPNPLLKLITVLFLAMTAWAYGISAHAARPAESTTEKEKQLEKPSLEYEVLTGDTLGAIAIKLGSSVEALMKANGIDNPDSVFAGQKLNLPVEKKAGRITKRGVRITVPKGFSLSRIAAAYKMKVASIVRANRLKNPDQLRAGQKLFIPGAEKIVELVPPPPCYKDPVTIYRVRNDVSQTVPLCFCNGRPNPKAIETISNMSGPVGKPVPFDLHPRLLKMLQRVSDKYPGKRIEIISGQRTRRQAGHESYHNKGQALDYRVQGVSNKELALFVRKFDNVGVGYYPNSVFIHMDTRDKSAWWIDYSGPGEKSIYGRAGMSHAQVEKVRSKRRAARTVATYSTSPKKTAKSLVPPSPEKTNVETELPKVATRDEILEEISRKILAEIAVNSTI
jgi:LysM repeat protein